MSKITITPDGAGTGTFSIASPNSNTNRTLTLPDSTGELLNAESSLNATKLTGALPAIDASNVTGIVIPPVFAPVAVTGATPSLDVGSYNFFQQGLTTADTTVSFASVPTNARWTYSFIPGFSEGYVLANSNYDNILFDVATQDTGPQGIDFSADGIYMYVVGNTNDAVYQYTLSKAWNASTAVYTRSFSVSAQETDPKDVNFKPDGTEMYVLGNTGDDVNQYTLSTAWDISSATYTRAYSVNAQEISPNGMSFSTNGLYMYVVGSSDDFVDQFTLSTAWDISTASFTRSYNTSGYENNPHSVVISSDGLRLFVTGGQTNMVNQWTLGTAYDISTAVFTVRRDYTAFDESPVGLRFSADGSKMYIVGGSTAIIYQFSTADVYTMTLPAAVSKAPRKVLEALAEVTYEFATLDGGTTVRLINEESV